MSVRMDLSGLKKLRDELEAIEKDKHKAFFEGCAKELAARLLAKVVTRTPVGKYPAGSGKLGGTLRRGWTGGTGKGNGFVDSLNVTNQGGYFIITLTNPVEYASYVDKGHRTSNHKGFVPGQFFVKISEEEVQAQAPGVIQRRLEEYLQEAFNSGK